METEGGCTTRSTPLVLMLGLVLVVLSVLLCLLASLSLSASFFSSFFSILTDDAGRSVFEEGMRAGGPDVELDEEEEEVDEEGADDVAEVGEEAGEAAGEAVAAAAAETVGARGWVVVGTGDVGAGADEDSLEWSPLCEHVPGTMLVGGDAGPHFSFSALSTIKTLLLLVLPVLRCAQCGSKWSERSLR